MEQTGNKWTNFAVIQPKAVVKTQLLPLRRPNYSHFPFEETFSFVVVCNPPESPNAARSQASLFSELDRLGAELDSDIQGLERKLSEKEQRRGRGEVLSAPS